MIISKIQGGIGNQMFQYAYGKHLSHKYNTDLRLDIRFYDYQGTPRRKFILNKISKTIVKFIKLLTTSITKNYHIY